VIYGLVHFLERRVMTAEDRGRLGVASGRRKSAGQGEPRASADAPG
jgi:hypothetical protein